MQNDKDAISIAKDAVLSWRYLARTRQDAESLKRLITRDEALNAWRVLASKPLKKGSFWEVANWIGRKAIGAHLTLADRRTGQEIREAAKEAAVLGKTLINLIERNSSLRVSGYELVPPSERAALDRLLGGLISQKVEKNSEEGSASDEFFSSEIEHELDAVQALNHPKYKDMTSSLAYRVLRWNQFDDTAFLERLRLFTKLAEESADIPPLVPDPKRDSASQHRFALWTCLTIVGYYGSPNYDVVADLTSAVFDTTISTENVKKWWQRRGPEWRGDDSAREI